MKELLKFLLALAYYLCWLLPFRRAQRRVVVYYHGVAPQERNSFARQMRYLAKHAASVRPSEIASTGKSDRLLVAITFDDAFRNLKENALPMMKSLGIHSAICVPAAYVGKTPGWEMEEGCEDRNEPIMEVGELKEAHAEGVEIFSHTMTHPRLTSLDEGQLTDELAQSRMVLEDMLGIPVRVISYPHGACDTRVFGVARRAGYRMGLTISPDFVEDGTENLAIGRTLVFPSDGMLVFALKINGAYAVMTRLKSVLGHGAKARPVCQDA